MPGKPADVFDRDQEWADLDRFVARTGRRIAVVYGRRRQGKSFLLTALAREAAGIYHQALEEERVPALERFARTLSAHVGAPTWTTARFDDWTVALRTAAEAADGHPIVLDEFPYLQHKAPELPSVIQGAYDAARTGAHPAFCLILCGSALSVMTELLTGQKAVRGRAQADMLIEPFDYRLSRRFWGIEDHQTAFLVNAVLGGPPGYRDLLNNDAPGRPADFPDWLMAGVLNPSHALFREADYLLAEDPALVDRSLYQTIVAQVASGTSTRDGLSKALGRPSSSLEYPISQLERARLVFRDNDLIRSNRPLLRVADPILRFSYNIIRPNLARFEARDTAAAWADAEPTFRSQVLGPHFEAMARDWARKFASPATLGGRAKQVGFVKVDVKEERRGYELDVVVEGVGARKGGLVTIIAIGEAKSSDRERGLRDLERLETLRVELARRADAGQAKLLLFGRSGFTSDLVNEAARRRDVELVDLARLYEGE